MAVLELAPKQNAQQDRFAAAVDEAFALKAQMTPLKKKLAPLEKRYKALTALLQESKRMVIESAAGYRYVKHTETNIVSDRESLQAMWDLLPEDLRFEFFRVHKGTLDTLLAAGRLEQAVYDTILNEYADTTTPGRFKEPEAGLQVQLRAA